MKKLMNIFVRDILSSKRDALALYIIIIPLIMAVMISISSSSLNDTTVRLAMLESDTSSHIEFMKEYSNVELFKSVEEIEKRVLKRDETVGLLPEGEDYNIILQGNESGTTGDFAKLLNSFYELGVSENDAEIKINNFNQQVSPIKKMLVIMLISLTIMLSGMLISLGIVEEKTENTINAINVTPISQNAFIIGKSLLGGIVTMISIIFALFITGFYEINWFMLLLVAFSSLVLSMLIGFIQGLTSDDVIEAAAGVKMLMLPIAGSIAGYELLADKWQWTMYWSPFYWAYKANDLILSNLADWPTILICLAFVIGISTLVFIVLMPKIRKGLS